LPVARLAFGLEHADHGEGHFEDADLGAHGILAFAEQLGGDRLTDHHDAVRSRVVAGREEAARRRIPVPHLGELRRRALGGRRPVFVPVDDLHALAAKVSDGADGQAFPLDGRGVLQRQGGYASPSRTDAAGRHRSRHDHQEVRAEALDLFLDGDVRALPDAHHGDHRRHADNDAEHREDRAHLVAPQSAKRRVQRHPQELHGGGGEVVSASL
jgi:hypothetical protein